MNSTQYSAHCVLFYSGTRCFRIGQTMNKILRGVFTYTRTQNQRKPRHRTLHCKQVLFFILDLKRKSSTLQHKNKQVLKGPKTIPAYRLRLSQKLLNPDGLSTEQGMCGGWHYLSTYSLRVGGRLWENHPRTP